MRKHSIHFNEGLAFLSKPIYIVAKSVSPPQEEGNRRTKLMLERPWSITSTSQGRTSNG